MLCRKIKFLILKHAFKIKAEVF
ncbi:hypothetical protein [Riemerella phage RAP44]|nr:hypothetical protein F372_gp59 [Riemerella phage RAP44]AEB71647.1 hypothetical protein [Riemerella phage RAP44]